jgi:glycosyltransferase involved in cell wall biosynthesis
MTTTIGHLLPLSVTAPGAVIQTLKLPSRCVRIASVITRMNVGGVAAHVVLASKYLEPLGFKTMLITGTLAPGERCADELIAELDESPVLIEELSRDPSITNDVVTLFRLIRLFKEYRPEIVHTHTSKAGALGRLAAWITGVPVRVHTYHGLVFSEHFSPLQSRFYAWIERQLARLSTRVIAISPKQKFDLGQKFRILAAERIECIPLGIDLDPFLNLTSNSQVLRRELRLSDGDHLVGWIGRLTPIKDPLFLVEVARRVIEKVPTCHFVVFGDGELRGVLEDALKQARLERHIHLLGWRNNLAALYNDLDLVVLTSKNEGTPQSLLETMASGKPFVASDVGGVSDLTTGEAEERPGVKYFDNAALAERTASALSSATVRLVEDAPLRQKMGVSGREFVSSRYSATRLAYDLANLYDRLLDERGSVYRAAVTSSCGGRA